jgi:hypothetical protein
VRHLAVVLALCVLLAGCSYREVNEHLPFPYERQDDTLELMAKSLGNTVVVPIEAVGLVTLGALVLGYMAASEAQRSKGWKTD